MLLISVGHVNKIKGILYVIIMRGKTFLLQGVFNLGFIHPKVIRSSSAQEILHYSAMTICEMMGM